MKKLTIAEAEAKRVEASLALADLAAYGFPVTRDHELAVAYRAAEDEVKKATRRRLLAGLPSGSHRAYVGALPSD